jgi:hypothetical protein
MLTNTDCTIFNRYVEAGEEKYQRTEIPAVAWENRKAANILRSGSLAADSVSVYIPFSIVCNYMKPVAWQSMINKSGLWTLQVGDVIVKGIVKDEITDAFTVSDMKSKYDDVVSIKSVDTMDNGSFSLRHWQIGAS